MKRTIASALLALLVALPGGARAAVVHEVAVESFAFTPSTVTAENGDTIRWDWISGFHSVVQDGTGTEICSPRFAGEGSCTLPVPASGLFTMHYHCGIHPGMMGTITTDRPPTITIDAPANGEIVAGPVIARGTAGDNSAVASVSISTKTEPLGLLQQTKLATCTSGCGTTSIKWSAELPLLPGRYSLTATVTDDNGLKTTAGPRVFVVI